MLYSSCCLAKFNQSDILNLKGFTVIAKKLLHGEKIIGDNSSFYTTFTDSSEVDDKIK